MDTALISHLHRDHLSLGSLEKIEHKLGYLVVPEHGMAHVPDSLTRGATARVVKATTMPSITWPRRLRARILASIVTATVVGCAPPPSIPGSATPIPPRPAPTATPVAPSMAPETPAPGLTAATMLRSTDLLADLASLETIERALHPGLLRYNTPAEIDGLFTAARREFARDRSLAEAFVALTRLTAALKCGHSYPNFLNQPKAIGSALFQGSRLPFWFRWIDDKMVIT